MLTRRTALLTGLALPALHRTGFAADPIKIGMTQPLTGSVAASGNYVANGAKIAVDVLNRAGGVLGAPIQLVLEDNKSNPREAVAAAEKLVLRDRVPVMIGAWSSTFTLSIMPKLLEYKVPMVVETSSAARITTSGNPYVFRIAPTSEMEAVAFAEQLAKFSPAIRKIDFLSVNNDFGRGATEKFTAALQAKGIGIGRTETMTPEATDLSAQITALKQSDGDTVFLTTGVEQQTLALRQGVEQRLGKRWVTTGGSFPDALLANPLPAGNTSYHILFYAPWFPERAPYPAIAKAYTDEWNKHGWEFAGLTEGFRGYDAVLTVVEAIKLAGRAESEAIREALWKVKLQGVNGDIAFMKEGPAGRESGQNKPNVAIVTLSEGKTGLL
ncbi:branched-chain amino acid transport system substrate-binding protein [Roseomonas rosea]|jgi:branched-chain amino acid transport system substrate-binding protein|uniref:Branched-chain amino acid transport system substrate-binding protein n=1 Tax=Muricoccus roseus TaxID=198092 RepID=A0A1M6I5F5_9PROT|nr:ABC transporter substrate-binding protein [Roseomonas rosea]SHJ29614.1 branched-chain amino acid transport system substrate-binding protein [Roseomonas rosea]